MNHDWKRLAPLSIRMEDSRVHKWVLNPMEGEPIFWACLSLYHSVH